MFRQILVLYLRKIRFEKTSTIFNNLFSQSCDQVTNFKGRLVKNMESCNFVLLNGRRVTV